MVKILRSPHRIKLLKKEAELVISLFRLVVLAFVLFLFGGTLFAISLRLMKNLKGAEQIYETITQSYVTLVIGLICSSILTMIALKKTPFRRIDKGFYFFEIWFYKLCGSLGQKSHSILRCWGVSDNFKYQTINYKEQRDIVNKISNSIERDRLSLTIGESGSGKTRCMMDITKKLYTDIDIRMQYNEALLYDISLPEHEGDLLNNIGSISHRNCIVFVDNFHLASARLLFDLTTHLQNELIIEKAFVIFAQPVKCWKTNPSSNLEIIREAQARNGLYTLTKITRQEIDAFLDSNDIDNFFNANFSIDNSSAKSIAEAMMVTSLSEHPEKGNDPRRRLYDIINNQLEYLSENTQKDIERLTIIIALSIHKGYFSTNDFIRLYWLIMSSKSFAYRLIRIYGGIIWIKSLRKVNVLPMLVSDRKKYVFHEALAVDWKDTLSKKSDVKDIFIPLFEEAASIQINCFDIDVARCWYLSVESRNINHIESYSDEARGYISIQKMIECIARNESILGSSLEASLQYAILLDKNGQFSLSRETIANIEKNLCNNESLGNRLLFHRLEADHEDSVLPQLERIIESADRYEVLIARYWQIHMQAHKGVFLPKELYDILQEACLILQERKNISQENVDFISRVFFDGCRHCYLSGGNIDTLHSFYTHESNHLLRKRSFQYKALCELYFQAHLFLYVFVYKYCFINDEKKDIESNKFKDIAHFTLKEFPDSLVGFEDTDKAIRFSRELYCSAERKFKQVGDREAFYLQADILNCDIMLLGESMENISGRIEAYEKSIFRTGFSDIYSYPSFYKMKLHALLYYNSFLSLDLTCKADERKMLIAIDICEEMIAYDKESGNQYGVWRGMFFKSIMKWELNRDRLYVFQSEQEDLYKKAIDNNYTRDSIIVDDILQRVDVHNNKTLPAVYIQKLIKFYPFVHQ